MPHVVRNAALFITSIHSATTWLPRQFFFRKALLVVVLAVLSSLFDQLRKCDCYRAYQLHHTVSGAFMEHNV